ncbi:MAG: hypothetical protein RhofKO_14730 [Rhodothermales bacterium]
MTLARSLNLIVIADDEAWGDDLAHHFEAVLPVVNSTVVLSVDEANVYLSASAFDVVFVGTQQPEAWEDEVYDAFIERWAAKVPLVLITPQVRTRGVVEALRAGFVEVFETDEVMQGSAGLGYRVLEAMQQVPTERQGTATEPSHALLHAIREKASKVHHDVNNPLAIISGNAQLFLELSTILGADEDLVQPVQDIEAASVRMAELLRGLLEIKQMAQAEQLTEHA